MSDNNPIIEAEQFARDGLPNDEIRTFLENVGTAPYKIEMILQDLDQKYPNRKRKRPLDMNDYIIFFGGGTALLVITLVLLLITNRIFIYLPIIGFFMIMAGIARIFRKRE